MGGRCSVLSELAPLRTNLYNSFGFLGTLAVSTPTTHPWPVFLLERGEVVGGQGWGCGYGITIHLMAKLGTLENGWRHLSNYLGNLHTCTDTSNSMFTYCTNTAGDESHVKFTTLQVVHFCGSSLRSNGEQCSVFADQKMDSNKILPKSIE